MRFLRILGAGVALVGLVALFAIFALRFREGVTPAADASSSTTAAGEESHPSFLHGRVTTVDGATFEGRLRWGGGEEAFWTDTFNGFEAENPWAGFVPPGRLPREAHPVTIFGLEIHRRERPLDLGRPYMARFGDLARIEAIGADVRVTLKSGATADLDRFEASDFDDGVRVWDGERGVVDLDSGRIRAIDLMPGPGPGVDPGRLHGTVRTENGEFTGFLLWNRQEGLGSDRLDGESVDGDVRLRFDDLRSIAREPDGGVRVSTADGRELTLAATGEVGPDHRGVYVDDSRYGRVLVTWQALERVDFSAPGTAGGGPVYGDFAPGRPLAGRVVTRDGRRLAGRLVYDLDESETTETLDAPAGGVDYILPFGRIDSIEPPARDGQGRRLARVVLAGGEVLALEADGDLGDRNLGLLVFVDGGEHPEYVPWGDVVRIELEAAPQPSAPPAENPVPSTGRATRASAGSSRGA